MLYILIVSYGRILSIYEVKKGEKHAILSQNGDVNVFSTF